MSESIEKELIDSINKQFVLVYCMLVIYSYQSMYTLLLRIITIRTKCHCIVAMYCFKNIYYF